MALWNAGCWNTKWWQAACVKRKKRKLFSSRYNPAHPEHAIDDMNLDGRIVFLMIFLACVGLLGYAFYLQMVKNLLPCPLCVVQRIAYWLTGLTALIAFFHAPGAGGRRFYGAVMALFAGSGAAVALAGALPGSIRMRNQSRGGISERVAPRPMVAGYV